ncbi:hypothetical protein tloyanaT_14670 [Thalassotalea loyana]|uniref:Solute-binding protein family 3/N-terminal domain-containing protein n=1 Tax=Thalassotalea loyana TaxID=280483 RepID=A0ABQ6HAR3_9GAMM|nr:hypothetical protein [Thalassotalea loyana]GLX85215.1 hypothetical protein tloyanaT_14670 [Thalassotalea loyana]
MSRHAFLLSFAIAIMVLFHFGARAQEQEFVIGVEDVNYYPLFNFNREQMRQPSFAFDILTAFFEHKNYKYRFVALPIKRFDKWFIDHNIDFKFPDNMRWRSDGGASLNLTFSDPVLTLMAGTYVLKPNAQIEKPRVQSLMTIRDFHPTLWLEEINQGQVTLHEERSPVGIIRHMLSQNVQATNIDSNVIRYQLQKMNKQGQIVLAKNIFHEQYTYHLSTNTHAEIIYEFNAFIKQERELIESLKKKYQIKEEWDE